MPEIQREEKDLMYTEEQWNAISARDRNILVSAAAGSGKTAVLVRRITRMLTEGEASIEKMLIVTFTRAAASEMKAKIIDSVTKAVSDDREKTALLKKQLDNMYRSNICTFDAFAYKIVKRYFYLAGCRADVKICDESDAAIMKAAAMEETFEELFETDFAAMSDFLSKFSNYKSDDAIKRGLVDLYDSIRSIPDYFDWMESAADDLRMSRERFEASPTGIRLKEKVNERLSEAKICFAEVSKIGERAGIGFQREVFDGDLAAIDQIASGEDIESIRRAAGAFKAGMLKRLSKKIGAEEAMAYESEKERIKIIREAGKKAVKGITDILGEPLDDAVDRMNATAEDAAFLIKLLKLFEGKYREAKDERNSADFGDIAHFAIEILKNEDVANEYRRRIDHIFIDEYQDSNLLQEKIIDSIKRDNNVFMVGDIKQSIYRFRLAEPAIFSAKYKSYDKYDSSCQQRNAVIDLNKNFRSKAGVIRAVNAVFGEIMPGYDDDAALHKGIAYTGDLEYKTQVHLIDLKVPEDENIDEELMNMKADEIEALKIADIIKENVGRTAILDSKTGKERFVKYSDIVILMRAVSSYADVFNQTLRDNGIECFVDNNGGYFDRIEIMTFVDILRVIDDLRQDIPLLGVLRSCVFGFSTEELIAIRINEKDVPYYKAFEDYAECGQDAVLRGKTERALERIKEWKKDSLYLPLSDLVRKLMYDTGYYTFTAAMPGGTARAAMLRAFADKAGSYASREGNSLYGFIRYIDKIRERKINIAQPNVLSENDDVVRLMTIHKSKGLEFPIVILAGIGRSLKHGKGNPGWSFHNKYGLGLKFADASENWYMKTINQNVIDAVDRDEELEEELRLLYVAFTRAEDKLIITGTSRDLERASTKYSGDIVSGSSQLSILYPVITKEKEIFEVFETAIADTSISSGADREYDIALNDILYGSMAGKYSSSERSLREEVDRRLSFSYPYEADAGAKSKYTVTELNSKSGENTFTLNEISSRDMSKGISGAEAGTAAHAFLAYIDLREASLYLKQSEEKCIQYLSEKKNEMVKREILTEQEAAAVDIRKIIGFLSSDLGMRAGAASIVRKERPFTVEHVDEQEGTVLVQGVIDCCFEENGELILIDYKTNRETEGIEEIYKKQIDIYREALEKLEGKRVKEAYLFLLGEGRSVIM